MLKAVVFSLRMNQLQSKAVSIITGNPVSLENLQVSSELTRKCAYASTGRQMSGELLKYTQCNKNKQMGSLCFANYMD